MSESVFTDELRAYESFAKLLNSAKEVYVQFRDANLPIPSPLARLLGDMGNGAVLPLANIPSSRPTPPKSPPRPPEAAQNWIWAKFSELTETTMVKAVVRNRVRASVDEIVQGVLKLKPTAVVNTIYNVIARLKNRSELKENQDETLSLINPTSAPILFEGHAWGRKDMLQTYEVAAYRREVILHLLKSTPTGLMNWQIVKFVNTEGISYIETNKDIVKTDLDILQREKFVMRSDDSSRLWIAVGGGKVGPNNNLTSQGGD